MNLEDKLVDLLIKKNYHISFAESLTGGLCAATIVNVSNASKVLNESVVTYSNEAKMKYLNVKKETIDKYDVVSEEVVYEMALGLMELTNSSICVSLSGVAGPTGGSDLIPVGTVCFGFNILGDIFTKKMNFGAIGRNNVRQKSVEYVLNTLLEILK